MKHRRNIILATALIACLFPLRGIGGLQAQVTTIDSGYCGDEGDSTNLTWTLTSDSVLTINGSGKMADYAYNSRSPWYTYNPKIKTIIIGDSVTTIGNFAFYYANIDSIAIPNSVTAIGVSTFLNSELTSVMIGKNVMIIGNGAFGHCYGLTSITIPNSVTTLGDGAFGDCYSLASVIIPNSIIIIGQRTFFSCRNLISVTIGENVSNIGQQAFRGCGSLDSITLHKKVIALGDRVFEDCRSLISVNMGDNLSLIGIEAFNNCSNLATLTVHPETPPMLINNVFNNVPTTASVYVKCESTPKYKADAGWSYFSNFYAIDPPPTPTLSVEQQNNTMQITWTSTGAPDYEIYRNNVRLTKTSTTSYTDSNLTSGTTYCYQIKAIEENCESLLSDTVCGTFSDVGIKQLRITNYELRVYPNPANYELKITNYELKEGDVIEIYNVVGQKVGAYPCGRPETTINVQHLPNGMYFIKVNERVSKFVKMSF